MLTLTACTEGNETVVEDAKKSKIGVEEEEHLEDEPVIVDTNLNDAALSISDDLTLHFIDVGQA